MPPVHSSTSPSTDLSRDERSQLTRILLQQAASLTGAERDEVLREVVLVNLAVAISIARRYRSRGIPTEDMEQVACAALVRAVHRYNLERGYDLLSYAVPCIRGEIRRYFRDFGWMIRPPRRVQENQSRVVDARERLRENDRAPSYAAIADEVGIAEDSVREALCAEGCFTPTSLDKRLGTDGSSSLGELLPDGTANQSQAAVDRVALGRAVRALSHRDRQLLGMRFFEDLTQQEIADRLEVTQTQISRRLKRILTHLRSRLTPAQAVAEPPLSPAPQAA